MKKRVSSRDKLYVPAVTSIRSVVRPTFREAGSQIVEGLRSFSVTTHPIKLGIMLAYALPRHGMTPAAGILGPALTWGSATALIDHHGSLTYRQLGAATERLAAGLAAQGVGVGTRVGIMLDDDRFLLMALGAVSLCGGHAWLINPRMGSDELQECLHADEIEMVVYSPVAIQALAVFQGRRVPVNELEQLMAQVGTRVPKNAKKAKFVMLTGGTTSAPQAIPIRRRVTAPLPALALAGATGVRHGKPTLVCAPLFHGYGLSCAFLGMVAGSPVVMSSACRVEGLGVLDKATTTRRIDWGQAIYSVSCREKVHTIFGVPAQLRALAAYLEESDPEICDAELVKHLVSGSDRLDESTIYTLQRRWGPVVTNYYGTTESGTVTMIRGQALESHPSSLGRPVAASRIRILDDRGHVQPRGVQGRIDITSPLASIGRSFTTSDIGWVDEEGYLYLEGRADDKVKAGGEFINLAKVEQVLTSIDGVEWAQADMAVDPKYGYRVTAKVGTTQHIDEEDLRTAVRRHLGPPSVPTTITQVPT
ncbi:MAG: acyl--CoA ligase [Propionibacteriaceae bacterium]|nr:acyl--CoA ligase [Propionibacteriaceae bacterium]